MLRVLCVEALEARSSQSARAPERVTGHREAKNKAKGKTQKCQPQLKIVNRQSSIGNTCSLFPVT
jgi:hypothetical protein